MRLISLPILLLFLVSSAASAAGSMVFVRQNDDGSSVLEIANDDGSNARELGAPGYVQLYPRISTDGREVVYSEGNVLNEFRIASLDLEARLVTEWTDLRGWHLQARFSGDGKLLAYSAPTTDGDVVIEIVDVAQARLNNLFAPVPDRGDGMARVRYTGPVRRIEEPGNKLYFPNLSSDGRLLVYHRTKDDDRKELILIDFDTGEKRTLTEIDGYAVAPSLSFDDRYVAFGTRFDGQSDIARLDLRTGEIVRLTNDRALDADPYFMPDGSISYTSIDGHIAGIFKLDATEIAAGSMPTVRPLIVRDSQLVFTASHSGDVGLTRELLTPMRNPPRSSFGTVRVGNKIFVSGGHQGAEHTYPPESFLDLVEYYDLETGTWHQVAPRPIAAHGYTLAAHGKYVYAFGGFTYSPDHMPRWKSIDAIDRYDVEQDRWETIGRLPRPRSSNVLGVVDGKVYLIGGWDSTPKFANDTEGRFHPEIDVFDLATETAYETDLVIPEPLRRAFSAVTIGDEIILVGGLGVGSTHFELLDNVTAFNPKTGTFRELPKLPFATFAPAAGVIGDRLYMFGGMFKTGPMDYRYVNHVFEYELGTDEPWHHAGRYLNGSKGFSQVVQLEDGSVAVLGGHSYDGDTDAPVTTVEKWSPTED